jgi:hypothetical protein
LPIVLAEVLVGVGDTVSIVTAWTYANLCHRSEVQEKLQQEIDEFITKHDRTPTFEDRLC